MLRSYEAIYDHGQLRWVNDAPKETPLRVIVTVIAEVKTATAESSIVKLNTQVSVPPFEKGGLGGILRAEDSPPETKIPLNPPFPKGEAVNSISLTSAPTCKRRRPPPELAGMMRVVTVEDDLVKPVPNLIIDPPFEKGGLGGFKNA